MPQSFFCSPGLQFLASQPCQVCSGQENHLKCLLYAHLHSQIENPGRERKVNKKHSFIVLTEKEYKATGKQIKNPCYCLLEYVWAHRTNFYLSIHTCLFWGNDGWEDKRIRLR